MAGILEALIAKGRSTLGPGQQNDIQFRLRQARKDLAAITKSIGKLALQYGFYDQSHFTKGCIAVYGIPPLRFRKMATDLSAVENAP